MTQTAAITCGEIVEIVTHYLEGALDSRDRHRFEQHLVQCEGCVNYVDQMRMTIALTGRLSEEDVAPEVQAALVEAFHGWRRGRDSPG